MRIIPAIDIINGKCVRLSKGDYSTQKVYNESPLAVAKEFESNGFKYLHLVDLDGAKANRVVNYKVLNEISSKTNLKVDFGGGLRSYADLKIAFENGANQITAGSIAVSNPALLLEWLAIYDSEKIILGADCHHKKIVINGWQHNSEMELIDFIKEFEKNGIEYVTCTDVEKDGMLQGTSNELYREILSETSVKLTASGGVSSMDDIYRLKELGCEAVIVGKAIYEKKISLKELSVLC